MKDGILGLSKWAGLFVVFLGLASFGGLFVNGTLMGIPPFSYLAYLVLHQVIGWIIILLAIWLVIQTLMKEFK